MKKVILLALASSILFASMSQADFPRRGRSCSAPAYSPCYETHAYVAPYVAPTVTTIIQEPLPVFVFQSMSGFPNLPASVTQPQQTYQPPIQAQPPSIGLSDKDVDRIASVVVQRLQGAASVAQNTMILGPPAIQEDSQQQSTLTMTQAQANDLGARCSQCHQEGRQTKSGLSLFNQSNQWFPMKGGQPYDAGRIYDRIVAREMPPSAQTNPADSPTADTIAFLKTVAGR